MSSIQIPKSYCTTLLKTIMDFERADCAFNDPAFSVSGSARPSRVAVRTRFFLCGQISSIRAANDPATDRCPPGMQSARNTLAVDHHHPLRSLAPLGFSDSCAPFFAGAKLPSRKRFAPVQLLALVQLAQEDAPDVQPDALLFPSRSRRQHVDGCGYFTSTLESLRMPPPTLTARLEMMRTASGVLTDCTIHIGMPRSLHSCWGFTVMVFSTERDDGEGATRRTLYKSDRNAAMTPSPRSFCLSRWVEGTEIPFSTMIAAWPLFPISASRRHHSVPTADCVERYARAEQPALRGRLRIRTSTVSASCRWLKEDPAKA